MSMSTRERRLRGRLPAAGLVAIAFAMMLVLAGSRVGQTFAQDASPDASPAAGDCVPGAGNAAASPAAMGDEATPDDVDAGPAGTPVTDADEAEAVLAAAENFVTCYNAGDFEAVVSLVTPNFLATSFSGMNGEDAVSALEDAEAAGFILPIEIVNADTESVQTYEDGRISIDIHYMSGEYQFSSATWYFVESDDELLLDQEEFTSPEPEGDQVVVGASYDPAAGESVVFDTFSEVTQTDVVIIHILNSDTQPHAFYAYRVPEDQVATPAADDEEAATPTSDDVLSGGEFIGSITVAGDDGQADLALVGLEAGTYALVDPGVEGSIATLTVAEAES